MKKFVVGILSLMFVAMLNACSSSGNENNGHKYVDLGLPSGVKWATCNIGANSPEEYGDFYAWGEVATKAEYTPRNSITFKRMTHGDVSGKAQEDEATANWGGAWRMPKVSEVHELINQCRWTLTELKGVKGYEVVGPNGNSIFLPAAGSSLNIPGEGGYYWSSTPDDSDIDHSYNLYYDTEGLVGVFYYDRFYGQSIRPVIVIE